MGVSNYVPCVLSSLCSHTNHGTFLGNEGIPYAGENNDDGLELGGCVGGV